MNTAKTTAYGHPRYRTADGQDYYPMTRRDAAAMVREAKARRELNRTVGTHGQVIYTISRERYVSFEIRMTINRRDQSTLFT